MSETGTANTTVVLHQGINVGALPEIEETGGTVRDLVRTLQRFPESWFVSIDWGDMCLTINEHQGQLVRRVCQDSRVFNGEPYECDSYTYPEGSRQVAVEFSGEILWVYAYDAETGSFGEIHDEQFPVVPKDHPGEDIG